MTTGHGGFDFKPDEALQLAANYREKAEGYREIVSKLFGAIDVGVVGSALCGGGIGGGINSAHTKSYQQLKQLCIEQANVHDRMAAAIQEGHVRYATAQENDRKGYNAVTDGDDGVSKNI